MLHLLSVAAGGATGALARYWVSGVLVNNAQYKLPYGTMLCNVLGSFLMGVFFCADHGKSPHQSGIKADPDGWFSGGFHNFFHLLAGSRDHAARRAYNVRRNLHINERSALHGRPV